MRACCRNYGCESGAFNVNRIAASGSRNDWLHAGRVSKMSTRMLACMTPKNLDEATESGETTTTTTSCDSRPDLRRLKAFTCQVRCRSFLLLWFWHRVSLHNRVSLKNCTEVICSGICGSGFAAEGVSFEGHCRCIQALVQTLHCICVRPGCSASSGSSSSSSRAFLLVGNCDRDPKWPVL